MTSVPVVDVHPQTVWRRVQSANRWRATRRGIALRVTRDGPSRYAAEVHDHPEWRAADARRTHWPTMHEAMRACETTVDRRLAVAGVLEWRAMPVVPPSAVTIYCARTADDFYVVAPMQDGAWLLSWRGAQHRVMRESSAEDGMARAERHATTGVWS